MGRPETTTDLLWTPSALYLDSCAIYWQIFFRLLVLVNCKKLNLCTNAIDKIANLNGLKNLVILNLARNNIKNLTGLDAVGDTLEQLWISYNSVEKLKGIQVAKKLKILQITNNKIKVKYLNFTSQYFHPHPIFTLILFSPLPYFHPHPIFTLTRFSPSPNFHPHPIFTLDSFSPWLSFEPPPRLEITNFLGLGWIFKTWRATRISGIRRTQ